MEGDCGSVEIGKEHFIELRLGKQAIKSIWRNQTDKAPEWNILHSVIMALTLPTEDHSEEWLRAVSFLRLLLVQKGNFVYMRLLIFILNIKTEKAKNSY